jgi:hypothetical protein
VLVAIFATLDSWKLAIIVSLALIFSYRFVIAYLYGYIAMPIMDMVCFLADDKSPLNIMSCIMMTDKTDIEGLRAIYGKVIRNHPKMYSHIHPFLGDYYYKPCQMPIDELLTKLVTFLPEGEVNCQEDVEKFLADKMGNPMPLNMPQFRAWGAPNYAGSGQTLVLQETHHSFCDGISFMHFHLQQDDKYDTSKVLRMTP